MKLIIEISLDNDTFKDPPSYEIITILESIRLRLETFSIQDLNDAPLFDSNGNAVGRCKIEGGK